ncbi:hypothetical protein QAD02_004027 [Eretmocerus hayati]|uniref:Uncharacterized protein n=1 Tax=Eretmocerus hayati TaxID=131215 RepID=A0ACC2NNT4_9HYME|nr:hypothetical protein QAD02_004027 [Eretmocerus hayati]
MLGVVNHIFKNLITVNEYDAMNWAQACNVAREVVYGEPAFAGNACKTLLNRVDLLRLRCSVECYVQCFSDFREVVDSCFSNSLDSKYVSYIKKFRCSFLDLGISVTPKVHAVFNHVKYFCEKVGRGLGFYSEQSVESVHADFKTTWNRYKFNNSNSEYYEKFLSAVCQYNSHHV